MSVTFIEGEVYLHQPWSVECHGTRIHGDDCECFFLVV